MKSFKIFKKCCGIQFITFNLNSEKANLIYLIVIRCFSDNARISMKRSLSHGKIECRELLRQERRTRTLFVNFYLLVGEKRTRTRKKATNDLFRKCTQSRFFPRIPEHFIRNRLFFRHLHLFSLKLILCASDKRFEEIILNIINNAVLIKKSNLHFLF